MMNAWNAYKINCCEKVFLFKISSFKLLNCMLSVWIKSLFHSKTILQRLYLYFTNKSLFSPPSDANFFYPPAENMFSLDETGFYNSCQPFLITFNTDTRTDSNTLINAKESHTTTALSFSLFPLQKFPWGLSMLNSAGNGCPIGWLQWPCIICSITDF